MEVDHQSLDSICENILSISRHLGLPLTDNLDNAHLSLFKTKLTEFAKESKKQKAIPSLLLPSNLSLNDNEWAKFGQYVDLMNADYAERALLLKRRAEVTIDSFLWSDRVKQIEDKIRQVLEVGGFTNVHFDPVHADDVLAANLDLLYVTKTSDAQLRRGKRTFVTDHRVKADIVPDRGGRTEQMQPMQRETFHQQETQRQQQQQFRGGGVGAGAGRGGGGGWKEGNRVQPTGAAGGGGGGGWQSGGYARGGGGRGSGKRGRYN